jgi:ABC-type antimicrobial peptide transport system permease subunit
MARRSEAEDIIGAIIGIIMVGWIFLTLANTPSPLQSYFQSFLADVIFGFILAVIIIIILLILSSLSKRDSF